MKKVLITPLVVLLVLACAGWLLYPMISDQAARGRDVAQMREYDRAVREMTTEQIQESFRQAEEYNASLTGDGIPDVFTEKKRNVSRTYQNTLNVREGIIGELVISRIGVSLPVYHTENGGNATEHLIHVEGTALPADRDGTHIVLAGPGIRKAGGIPGSLALTDARMLEDLDRIVPDDLLILRVLDRTLVYRVEGVQTLAAEGLASLDISAEEGERTLTLITARKDQRLLIRAKQVSVAEAKDKLAAEDRAEIPVSLVNILCMGIPVMLAGILVIIITERILRRKYRLPTEHRKRDKETVFPEEENVSDPERDGVSG